MLGAVLFILGFLLGNIAAHTDWLFAIDLEWKVSVGTLFEIATTIFFVVFLTLYLSHFSSLNNKIKEIFVGRCDRSLNKLDACNTRFEGLSNVTDEEPRRQIISELNKMANDLNIGILFIEEQWGNAGLSEISFTVIKDASKRYYNSLNDNDDLFVQPVPVATINNIHRCYVDLRNEFQSLQVEVIRA